MPSFTVHHISRDSHGSSSSGTAYEIDAPSFSTLDITSGASTPPTEKPPSEPSEPWTDSEYLEEEEEEDETPGPPIPSRIPSNFFETGFFADLGQSPDSASLDSSHECGSSLSPCFSDDSFHTTFGHSSSAHRLNDPRITELPPITSDFRLPPPTVPFFSSNARHRSYLSPNWRSYPLPLQNQTLRHTGPSITNAHLRSSLSALSTRTVTPCPSRYDLSELDAQVARRYVRCFEQISEGDTVSLGSRFSSLFTQSQVALSDRAADEGGSTEAGESYDADGEEEGAVRLPLEGDAMMAIRRPRRISLMETIRKTKRRISRGCYSENSVNNGENRLSYTPGDDHAGVSLGKRSDDIRKDTDESIAKKRKFSELGGSIKRRVVSWRRKFSRSKDAGNLNGYGDKDEA